MRSLLNSFRSFSSELDPVRLRRKFLEALLEIHKVTRGSIWIKERGGYRCVEAVGGQSDRIRRLHVPADSDSIVGWVIENGRMTVADPKTDRRHCRNVEKDLQVKSSRILCFPLLLKDGTVYGAVQLIDTETDAASTALGRDYLRELQDLVDIGADALNNALMYAREVHEKATLKSKLQSIRNQPALIGQASAFLKAKAFMETYADTHYPVLITGESGTGKELFARRIHQLSSRAKNPFLIQNCTAIPESLLESELFGYRKGAFSGAVRDRIGLFEAADGGTLFLDEIGDMPADIQAKILRVLQGGEIKPLGSTQVKNVDVRIISATNRDLRLMVDQKTFRQDLFYRLSVLPLKLPPLRERREDIPLLIRHFLNREAARLGVEAKGMRSEAVRCLTRYPWAGNIRELENLIRYLLVVAEGRRIDVTDFPEHIPVRRADIHKGVGGEEVEQAPDGRSAEASESGRLRFGGRTWADVDREYALDILDRHQWNIASAARAAGIHRSTFVSRLRRMGIQRRR
ncbi:MAG: sigma-54-dependent Fis family transcriptional regulator [Desulfobacterales bacterium]